MFLLFHSLPSADHFRRCVVDVAIVRCIPPARIFNLARVSPDDLEERSSGAGTAIASKGAPVGELADCVWIGFVESSHLIDGRTYSARDGLTRALKELHISPVQQEHERAMAALSAVLKGKMVTLPVTEQGAITFSTKHTNVDENGDPINKSKWSVRLLIYLSSSMYAESGLSGKFLTKVTKSSARGVVHSSIQRRPREGTDTGMCLIIYISRPY